MIRKGTRVRVKPDADVSVVGSTGVIIGKGYAYDWRVKLDHEGRWAFNTNELERENVKESKQIIRKGTRVRVVANTAMNGSCKSFVGRTGKVLGPAPYKQGVFDLSVMLDPQGDSLESEHMFRRDELEREDASK